MINQLLPNNEAVQELTSRFRNKVITHQAIHCYQEEMSIMLPNSSKIYEDQDFIVHRLDRVENNNRIVKYFYSYDSNLIGCLKFVIADFYYNINLTPSQDDYNVLIIDVQLSQLVYRQLIECCELFFKNISKAYYMIPAEGRNYQLPDRQMNRVWKILNRSDANYVMKKMTTSNIFDSEERDINSMIDDYRMMKIVKK